MSKRRLPKTDLQKDLEAHDAIVELKDFMPGNPQHKPDALAALKQAMVADQAAKDALIRDLAAARDKVSDSEWAYHNTLKEARIPVRGQYGVDSNETQSVGFKKSSEIRRGRPKPADPKP